MTAEEEHLLCFLLPSRCGKRNRADGGVFGRGADESGARRDLFGLLGLVHGAKVRPEPRHAQDGGGRGVQGGAELSRRGEAEAGRTGAEDRAGSRQRSEHIHAAVRAGDIQLNLEGVYAGDDGIAEKRCTIHNERQRCAIAQSRNL